MSRIDIEALEEELEEEFGDVPSRPGPRRSPRGRPADGHLEGRVIALHKGWVDVVAGERQFEAVYAGSMRGEQVVVGDRVRLRPPRHESDTARVVERLERGTVLTRTADDTVAEERLLAANVDLAVAVVSTDQGEVGERFVDRILVAAEAGGLAGAVCVNKVDLPGDPQRFVRQYARLGYPVVLTSAASGQGLEDLRGLLARRWSVLTGHSGVGKTSLTNLLVPGAERQVGEMGRFGGRHTTVSPEALPVPGVEDAWLVDTPGVRSFGIAHVPADDLAWCFPELRDLPCELPGCLHDGEPGCAVPERLADAISVARYDSYRRLLASLRGGAA